MIKRKETEEKGNDKTERKKGQQILPVDVDDMIRKVATFVLLVSWLFKFRIVSNGFRLLTSCQT